MASDQNIEQRNLSADWPVALFCGAANIGSVAFLSTLLSNIRLRVSMAQGLSLNEAYAAQMSLTISFPLLLSVCIQIAPGVLCGFVSAKYGRGHPLNQASISGLLGTGFYLVMLLNPSSLSYMTLWLWLFGLLAPFLASLAGGYLYQRLHKAL